MKNNHRAVVSLRASALTQACPVLSCPVLSCPVLSCPVLSCPVLSCPPSQSQVPVPYAVPHLPSLLQWSPVSAECLSCPVLSCPVLSCPVLSCPVLSCPASQSKVPYHTFHPSSSGPLSVVSEWNVFKSCTVKQILRWLPCNSDNTPGAHLKVKQITKIKPTKQNKRKLTPTDL